MNIKQTILNYLDPALRQERKQSMTKRIVETSKNKVRATIKNYIQAVEDAQRKNVQQRIQYYDHCQQTLDFDPHVIAMMDKRLNNIDNKKIVLMNNDKPVEGFESFFEAPKFRKFAKRVVFSKIFSGMGLFELYADDFQGRRWFDFAEIPIKHINPYSREVLINQNDSRGLKFTNNMIFVGDADNLGLLKQITLLSLYGRFGLQSYQRYMELAGENFRTYETTEFNDDKGAHDMQKALQNMGSGGILRTPPGVDMKMHDGSSSSQNQLFENYIKELKDQITVSVLGQTMTTDDGSSRSQAEVHQDEQENIFAADEEMLTDFLNYDFIDKHGIWGLPSTPGLHYELHPTSEHEVKAKLYYYEKLKNLGYEFDREKLEETFKSLL